MNEPLSDEELNGWAEMIRHDGTGRADIIRRLITEVRRLRAIARAAEEMLTPHDARGTTPPTTPAGVKKVGDW